MSFSQKAINNEGVGPETIPILKKDNKTRKYKLSLQGRSSDLLHYLTQSSNHCEVSTLHSTEAKTELTSQDPRMSNQDA